MSGFCMSLSSLDLFFIWIAISDKVSNIITFAANKSLAIKYQSILCLYVYSLKIVLNFYVVFFALTMKFGDSMTFLRYSFGDLYGCVGSNAHITDLKLTWK